MSTELFHIVRALLQKSSDSGLTVMVTSTQVGEGKSLLLRYLAWTAQLQLKRPILYSIDKPHQPMWSSSAEQLSAIHASQELSWHAKEAESSLENQATQRKSQPTGPEPRGTILPQIDQWNLGMLEENPYVFLARELPIMRSNYGLILVEASAFQEKDGSMPPGLLSPLFDHSVVVFHPHTTSIEGIQKSLQTLRQGEGNCSLLVNHGGADSMSNSTWGQALHKAWTERMLEALWFRAKAWWNNKRGRTGAATAEQHTLGEEIH